MGRERGPAAGHDVMRLGYINPWDLRAAAEGQCQIWELDIRVEMSGPHGVKD